MYSAYFGVQDSTSGRTGGSGDVLKVVRQVAGIGRMTGHDKIDKGQTRKGAARKRLGGDGRGLGGREPEPPRRERTSPRFPPNGQSQFRLQRLPP